VRLADRYDLAIMSTKGMSVVASRHLIDEVCGRHGLPLLVLHDFDKNGFSIQGTLCGDNHRYRFKHKINPIDLGLRLTDVEKQGLTAESVYIEDTPKARRNLKRNGAKDDEIDFLLSGQRVESNAFASRPLINWLEAKLHKNGVKKVLPDTDVLETAYKAAFVRRFVADGARELESQARQLLDAAGVPSTLRKQVAAAFKIEPAAPWDGAVADIAGRAAERFKTPDRG